MTKLTSHSRNQTLKLAKNFAKKLRGGEVLALFGHLGSGKTTFVKGLARGLGIKKIVSSPTFVILSSYQSGGKRPKIFHHFDLYRLKNRGELAELGFSKILKDRKSIKAIEWPEKAAKFLPPNTLNLKFSHGLKPSQRIIKIL